MFPFIYYKFIMCFFDNPTYDLNFALGNFDKNIEMKGKVFVVLIDNPTKSC